MYMLCFFYTKFMMLLLGVFTVLSSRAYVLAKTFKSIHLPPVYF